MSQAALEWARVDKASAAELETFLRRHGSSPEAPYARARLEDLNKQRVALPAPSPSASPSSKESMGTCGTDYLSDLQQVIRGCTEILGRDPKNVAGLYIRGLAYLRSRQYDASVQDYDRALQINPRMEGAYNNRGLAYANKKLYDLAKRDFEQSIALRPTDQTYVNLGATYSVQGQLDKALQYYNKAIELNPRYAPAYSNRGDAYMKQGKRSQAMAEYRQVLAIDPSHKHAKEALASLGVKR